MELSSQPEVKKPENLSVLEAQIRELFGRTVYTHKVHEKNADIYLSRLNIIKILQIVLSAITTGGLMIALFGKDNTATLISAILSAILLVLTTYTKDYDLGTLAQKHSETASKIWDVRESYLSLLTDIGTGQISIKTVYELRSVLQERLKTIYETAPRTIPKAYEMAQDALKFKEDLTFSDEELNVFLPKALHRNNQSKMTVEKKLTESEISNRQLDT